MESINFNSVITNFYNSKKFSTQDYLQMLFKKLHHDNIRIEFLTKKNIPNPLVGNYYTYDLINDPDLVPKDKKKYTEMQVKLTDMLIFDLRKFKTIESFDDFCDKKGMKVWKDKTKSYIAVPLDENGEYKFMQRLQLKGLCFLTAGAVIQHYLLNRVRKEPRVLDEIDYAKTQFDDAYMKKYIINNEGGKIYNMLKTVLEPESELDNYGREKIILEKYGPLLVSSFKMFPDFKDKKSYCLRGKPKGATDSNHAMVMIGIRQEGDNTYYLLQNWWTNKQFVEVDGAYFRGCAAVTWCSLTPQMNIDPKFKLTENFFDTLLSKKKYSINI